MARLVSAREGIKVVLAGSVERSGEGYSAEGGRDRPGGGQGARRPRRGDCRLARANPRRGRHGGRSAPQVRSATRAAERRAGGRRRERDRQLARGARRPTRGRRSSQPTPQRPGGARRLPRRRSGSTRSFGRAYAGHGRPLLRTCKDEARPKAAYDKALKLRRPDDATARSTGRWAATTWSSAATTRRPSRTTRRWSSSTRRTRPATGTSAIAYLVHGQPAASDRAGPRRSSELNPRSASDRYNYAMYSDLRGRLRHRHGRGHPGDAKESPPIARAACLPVALAKLLRGRPRGRADDLRPDRAG